MHKTMKMALSSLSKLEYDWNNGFSKLSFDIYNKKEDKLDIDGVCIELMSLLSKCDDCRNHISNLQFTIDYPSLSKRIDCMSGKIENALLNIKVIKQLRKDKLSQFRIKANENKTTTKLKNRISIVGSAISNNINRKWTLSGASGTNNNSEDCKQMNKTDCKTEQPSRVFSNSNIVGLDSAPVLAKLINCKIPKYLLLDVEYSHNQKSNRKSLNMVNVSVHHRLSKVNRKMSQMTHRSNNNHKSNELYESKMCEMSEEKSVVTITNNWIKIDLNC